MKEYEIQSAHKLATSSHCKIWFSSKITGMRSCNHLFFSPLPVSQIWTHIWVHSIQEQAWRQHVFPKRFLAKRNRWLHDRIQSGSHLFFPPSLCVDWISHSFILFLFWKQKVVTHSVNTRTSFFSHLPVSWILTCIWVNSGTNFVATRYFLQDFFAKRFFQKRYVTNSDERRQHCVYVYNVYIFICIRRYFATRFLVARFLHTGYAACWFRLSF